MRKVVVVNKKVNVIHQIVDVIKQETYISCFFIDTSFEIVSNIKEAKVVPIITS